MGKIKNMRVTEVEEYDYGVYVWEMPDGRIVANEEGEYMSIQAKRNDIKAIMALTKAAEYYGCSAGKPKFLQGRRKVSQSEYEDQMERMQEGQIPDPIDLGNTEGTV